jgi:tetratricopeptide (TPR) repeat protein
MGFLAGLVAQAKRTSQETVRATAPETEAEAEPVLTPLQTIRHPLVRDAVVALAAVGAIILPLSISQGVHYWRSMKVYALGFSYLENASNLFAKGNAEASSLTDYFTEAIDYFEDSLRQDPANTSAYYKLGSAYCSLSQLEEQLAKDKKQKNPAESTRHQALADQNLDKAVKAYEDLARLSPDYAEIHYNFGIIYHLLAEKLRRQGLTEEATEKDNLALRHLLQMARQSNKSEVATLAAQQFMVLQRWDEALAILRAASGRNPDEFGLAAQYMQAAQKAGKPEDAAKAQARIENIKTKKATKP